MRVAHFSLSVLSLAISGHAFAESTAVSSSISNAQSTESVAAKQRPQSTLSPIVVTATRSPTSIAQIAGTVQTISQQQITQQSAAGKKVADILAQLMPSLAASSGTISNYGQTMRGRQLQVMIDGVPQTGSRDVSRQLNSISPDLIDHVEVVSGATSIYGSGATGGLINIITKRAKKGEPLSFETKVGLTASDKTSADSLAYEVAQSASFSTGAVDGFIGASLTQRGEQQDSRGNRIAPEPAQTDRQDTQTVDVNGRLNIRLTDMQNISMGAQYYKDEQDSDYAPDYGSRLAVLFGGQPSMKAVKGLQLDDQPFTERYAANAQYQNNDLFGQKLTAEAYYRKENSRFFPSVFPINVARAPITDEQKKQLAAGAYGVFQSESEVEVFGARTALQSKLNIADKALNLTYGVDYEKESDKQVADSYNLATFMASNGLQYQSDGKTYGFGPDTDVQKIGAFLQSKLELTDKVTVQAGVRHERIDSDTQSFTPLNEAKLADLLAGFRVPYQASTVDAGKVKHDATLFNLGTVYALTDAQQVFANFSQGFSLPDLQRMLRDVEPEFAVNSSNIDPIKVNNYELGWRMQGEQGLNLGLTGFYNTSDKVVQFKTDRTVSVADTDERIYGAEANLSVPVLDQFKVGGTVAYTRGQFKDAAGQWRELNAFRVSPVKGTIFGEWEDDNGNGVRLQALAIGGSDRANKDVKLTVTDSNVRATPASKIKGYAVMDVLAHTNVLGGRVDFGIYNFWNTNYRTVYSQEAAATYGALSSIPAEGRTYGLSYTIKY